ncbi:MAG: hypothetical protein PVF47_02200 [Anaerolineae bacterium]|jgi:hypothetical protein
MKWKRIVSILVLVAFLLALLVGGAALAQSSENYRIGRYALVSGGPAVSSDRYVVRSTIGQWAGAADPPSGSNYVVKGGFLPGTGANRLYRIYLPLTMRQAHSQ